jgi:hypothetical protein
MKDRELKNMPVEVEYDVNKLIMKPTLFVMILNHMIFIVKDLMIAISDFV